jgi:hypothetical protein
MRKGDAVFKIGNNTMLKIIKIIASVILTILLACGHSANQGQDNSLLSDKYHLDDVNQLLAEKKWTEKEKPTPKGDRDVIDSLRFDMALQHAFKVAKKAFKKNHFVKQYEFNPGDSLPIIKIDIFIGQLFNDNQKYFLLRRDDSWATRIDLYEIANGTTEKLMERKQEAMTYLRDTIFDVNGDGVDDFLVHWYPSSGCCRRNVYNVYLNQNGKGKFTKNYEFINPTFAPAEKIVRGVLYGHPGETGLYKYKWNEFQVDTIEFIYPDPTMKTQFIKTKKRTHQPSEENGLVLKTVPEEYHKIESYEWFARY